MAAPPVGIYSIAEYRQNKDALLTHLDNLPLVRIPDLLQPKFLGLKSVPMYYFDYVGRVQAKGKVFGRVLALTSEQLVICGIKGAVKRCIELCDIVDIVVDGTKDVRRHEVGTALGDQASRFTRLYLTFRSGYNLYLQVIRNAFVLVRAISSLSQKEVHIVEAAKDFDLKMNMNHLKCPDGRRAKENFKHFRMPRVTYLSHPELAHRQADIIAMTVCTQGSDSLLQKSGNSFRPPLSPMINTLLGATETRSSALGSPPGLSLSLSPTCQDGLPRDRLQVPKSSLMNNHNKDGFDPTRAMSNLQSHNTSPLQLPHFLGASVDGDRRANSRGSLTSSGLAEVAQLADSLIDGPPEARKARMLKQRAITPPPLSSQTRGVRIGSRRGPVGGMWALQVDIPNPNGSDEMCVPVNKTTSTNDTSASAAKRRSRLPGQQHGSRSELSMAVDECSFFLSPCTETLSVPHLRGREMESPISQLTACDALSEFGGTQGSSVKSLDRSPRAAQRRALARPTTPGHHNVHPRHSSQFLQLSPESSPTPTPNASDRTGEASGPAVLAQAELAREMPAVMRGRRAPLNSVRDCDGSAQSDSEGDPAAEASKHRSSQSLSDSQKTLSQSRSSGTTSGGRRVPKNTHTNVVISGVGWGVSGSQLPMSRSAATTVTESPTLRPNSTRTYPRSNTDMFGEEVGSVNECSTPDPNDLAALPQSAAQLSFSDEVEVKLKEEEVWGRRGTEFYTGDCTETESAATPAAETPLLCAKVATPASDGDRAAATPSVPALAAPASLLLAAALPHRAQNPSQSPCRAHGHNPLGSPRSPERARGGQGGVTHLCAPTPGSRSSAAAIPASQPFFRTAPASCLMKSKGLSHAASPPTSQSPLLTPASYLGTPPHTVVRNATVAPTAILSPLSGRSSSPRAPDTVVASTPTHVPVTQAAPHSTPVPLFVGTSHDTAPAAVVSPSLVPTVSREASDAGGGGLSSPLRQDRIPRKVAKAGFAFTYETQTQTQGQSDSPYIATATACREHCAAATTPLSHKTFTDATFGHSDDSNGVGSDSCWQQATTPLSASSVRRGFTKELLAAPTPSPPVQLRAGVLTTSPHTPVLLRRLLGSHPWQSSASGASCPPRVALPAALPARSLCGAAAVALEEL
eukprot:TRINITY_DN1891_c0_g2_i2.p1 TRINITY_DN1891_c0_g2~~TRINITY_DN1891_c0_g2_i2.p1  ORF type:complete len:1178 (+),score=84.67 TRINITY_DN1891_c0_g2_i2:107-3535(+)